MISTVIFDFDGTIINTNGLIEEGLQYFAMRYRGYRLTKDELLAMTGRPLEDQMAHINKDKTIIMAEQFRIWYNHHHNEKASAFPGILRMIQRLKENGYRLAIVTNNSRASLEMGLAHLNLHNTFEYTLTKDDVEETKPSPEGLNRVLDLFEAHPSEALYIGDTGNDLLAAKSAGMASVLVAWTTMSTQMIERFAPTYILNAPVELFRIIESLSEAA